MFCSKSRKELKKTRRTEAHCYFSTSISIIIRNSMQIESLFSRMEWAAAQIEWQRQRGQREQKHENEQMF